MPDIQNYKCVVKDCSSNGNRRRRFYGFPFPFPDIMLKWQENLRLENVQVKKYMNVCSLHFEKNVIGRRKILKGGVPTLHLGHSYGAKHKSELCRYQNVMKAKKVEEQQRRQRFMILKNLHDAVRERERDTVAMEEPQYEVCVLNENEPPPLHYFTPLEKIYNSMLQTTETQNEFIVPINMEHNYTAKEEVPPLAYFSDEQQTDDNSDLQYISIDKEEYCMVEQLEMDELLDNVTIYEQTDSEAEDSPSDIIVYGEDDAVAHFI